MGIKKKHVPGCQCCGASVPPAGPTCCMAPQPATITVVISGVAARHDTGCPECADMNGTWVCAPISPCIWVSNEYNGLNVQIHIPNPSARSYEIRVNWFSSYLIVSAEVASAVDCASLSSFVIELLGDQTSTNGCCTFTASSEASLTA